MSVVNEFKQFIARGNVVDMAVGVIIGGAFGKIVSSFTEDVIMPPIGVLLGKVDFGSLYIPLVTDFSQYLHPGELTDKITSLWGLPISKIREMGVPIIAYGSFINQVINFLIIAACVFLLVKAINRVSAKAEPAPELAPLWLRPGALSV